MNPLSSFRNERLSTEPADYRKPSETDRDRVLYCPAFRRLGGVTQVVGGSEEQLFHNRLTHSLKVAQVARRLAQRINTDATADEVLAAGGIDEDVAEAAALAHDLGLPPFGRAGEEELKALLTEDSVDGFEGNAQSFRIVTKLAFRGREKGNPALNLTRATLRAMLKYPWFRDQAPQGYSQQKWGAYASEEKQFNFTVKSAKPRWPSAEALVVEWADDLSYAVHDVEDFYRAGLIPLDRLVCSDNEAESFIAATTAELALQGDDRKECVEAFSRLRQVVPRGGYKGSVDDIVSLHELVSTLITKYLNAVTIRPDGGIRIDREAVTEVTVLKRMTHFYVIDDPMLGTARRRHRRIVNDLFRELRAWAGEATKNDRELARLPANFRGLILAARTDEGLTEAAAHDDGLNVRATADYIASLTEVQAIRLHELLMGPSPSPSSVPEAWIRV